MSILSNTVSRAGIIEDGLSQIMNMQYGYVDVPFVPIMISELPVGAIADEPGVENGAGNMDTDVVNKPMSENLGLDDID